MRSYRIGPGFESQRGYTPIPTISHGDTMTTEIEITIHTETTDDFPVVAEKFATAESFLGYTAYYVSTINQTDASIIYDLIDKDEWDAAEEALADYYSKYGGDTEYIRMDTMLSVTRPTPIDTISKLGLQMSRVKTNLGTESVVFLCYSEYYGESDRTAALSAKEDIEGFTLKGPQPIYFFGNYTYLNEWRIAQCHSELADYKLVSLYDNRDGTYSTQNFTNGRADFWPKVMEVADDQLDELLTTDWRELR